MGNGQVPAGQVMRIMNSLLKFVQDDDATTAVEYAVMLAMILIGVITGLYAAGGGAAGWWGNINTEMSTYGL